MMKLRVLCTLCIMHCAFSLAQPRPERAVEPLLKTIRVQSAPYNASCPYYNYGDSISSEPCLVGCVATAIEQLLSFYRYPDAICDSIPGWTTENYSIATVPSGSKIDWDDVADLSLWCGMMVKMKYTPDASATSMWRAEEPLKRIFGYKTVRMLDRCMYTYDDWHRILQTELMAGRPVAYVGASNVMISHAFNIDGVDENGLYHCNWGENNEQNGYFDLDYLTELQPHCDATEWGRMVGFHANQYMLVLHPDSVPDTLVPDTLEDFAHVVKVEDIAFRRNITNREYVLTDVTLTNLTADTLYHTYMILQNATSDTSLIEQGKAISLCSMKLLPGETRTQAVAAHYTATKGRWLVSITFDGIEVAYTKEVDVYQAVVDKISVPEEPQVAYPETGTVRVAMKLHNGAEGGVSGRMLYFRLYREDEEASCSMDYRFLNLPGGETVKDTVYFHNLSPETAYTLKVGGWSSAICTIPFTMPKEEVGISDVEASDDHSTSGNGNMWYDATGRTIHYPRKGLYIKNGKKVFMP